MSAVSLRDSCTALRIRSTQANGYSEEQIKCVRDEYENCKPPSTTSEAVAWTSMQEALAVASEPPQDPEDRTCEEKSTAAIICEVCPG